MACIQTLLDLNDSLLSCLPRHGVRETSSFCDLHSAPSSQQNLLLEKSLSWRSRLICCCLGDRKMAEKSGCICFSPSFLKSSWGVWPHVEKVSLKGCRCGDSREEVHFINSSPTFFSLFLFLTQTLFSHFFQSCYWFLKKQFISPSVSSLLSFYLFFQHTLHHLKTFCA